MKRDGSNGKVCRCIFHCERESTFLSNATTTIVPENTVICHTSVYWVSFTFCIKGFGHLLNFPIVISPLAIRIPFTAFFLLCLIPSQSIPNDFVSQLVTTFQRKFSLVFNRFIFLLSFYL